MIAGAICALIAAGRDVGWARTNGLLTYGGGMEVTDAGADEKAGVLQGRCPRRCGPGRTGSR